MSPKPSQRVIAALNRIPFVPFLLTQKQRQFLIIDPQEISLDRQTITLSLPLDSVHVVPLPENHLIREEQQVGQPREHMLDPPDPISAKELRNKPEFTTALRAAFADFRHNLAASNKYGFSRPAVEKCPRAIPLGKALALGWFSELKTGHHSLTPVTTEKQLRPILERLEYPYLSQGVVTHKGAHRLVREWQMKRRAENNNRMRRARKNQIRTKSERENQGLARKTKKPKNSAIKS